MLGVSHAMNIVVNMTVLEQDCDFFMQHATQFCGIPMCVAERLHVALLAQIVLKNSQDVAHESMLRLVKNKVDEFMLVTDNINWNVHEVPQNGSEYLKEVVIYFRTLVSIEQQILPLDALEKVGTGVLNHI